MNTGTLRKRFLLISLQILIFHLLLLEKAGLDIFNPPGDVTKGMVLYRVVNDQFIILSRSNELHEDENRVRGTFYITGRFSLGTPTAAEVSSHSKKLSAYNPIRPLVYSDVDPDKQVQLYAENTFSEFRGHGGPPVEINSE